MLWVLATAILGWAAGALVNYLADVLPLRRRLTRPFCRRCEATLDLRNYFLWPRRCPNCGAARSLRSLLVELLFPAAAVFLWLTGASRLPFALELVWLSYFSLVTVIDLEHRLILHPVSLAGVALALPTGIWLHGLLPTLLGGAAGFGIMLGLYFLGIGLARLLARWRGGDADGEALGFGDVNLSGVLGLLLGWPGISAGLVLTILVGGLGAFAALAAARLQGRYSPDLTIPYGPFLVISASFLLFFSQYL